MTDVVDDLTNEQQLNNFVNGIVKRLLLLLLTYFVNNIVVNKIENRHISFSHIVNVIGKIKKPMLTTLSHLAQHNGTTRRILEVEEMLPSTTAKWCLDRLLEWQFIKFQTSVKDYPGRNFKIYFLTDSTSDIVNKIEAKHIELHSKLRKIRPSSKFETEEKEMLLFKCVDCQETKWATDSTKACPSCGSDKLARVMGGREYEFGHNNNLSR